MAKFNLKEHIAKNKATFFGSLTEGQFSWFTQDTDQQIGSEPENTLPFVYMHDDKGNKWLEKNYEGYGEFGGKDYYELLDQMNGGIGDREEGIRKAFDAPAVANGEIKFPALTVSATLPSGHDFTQEAEHDPNQSWYQEPEEDEENDDYYSNEYGDEDEEELEEGEAAYEYEKGKEAGEKIEKTKMKKSELKAKIKEMIVAEMDGPAVEDSQYDFLKEMENMLDEADEDTADAEAAADAGAEDTEVTDTEVTTDVTTDEVDPNVKAVQDALTQAQAAAQQLGDKKLMDQIGNTITFFTRSHVVEKPGAVSENLNESMFPMLKKILK